MLKGLSLLRKGTMRLSKRWRKIRRRLKRYHIPHRIVSMGGVGSSSLVRHLEEGDRDRIWYHSRDKHCIHPDLLPEARKAAQAGGEVESRQADGGHPPDTIRACFLFGDPYAAVVSVFRRGLHRRHEQAMARAKPGYQAVLQHDTTLQEYLTTGVDRFFLQEHLDNWLHYSGTNVQIMAVKYEALAEHIDDVLRFLRCDRPFQVRPRTSDPTEQPPEILKGLESVYGGLRRRIDGLPSLIRVSAP